MSARRTASARSARWFVHLLFHLVLTCLLRSNPLHVTQYSVVSIELCAYAVVKPCLLVETAPGYYAATTTLVCTACPAQSESWGTGVLFTIILIIILLILFYFMNRSAVQSSCVGMPSVLLFHRPGAPGRIPKGDIFKILKHLYERGQPPLDAVS